MQVSKQQLKPSLEKEIKNMLAQVIADIPNKERALVFLEDFLSETEFMALSKRLAVVLYLSKGKSYEDIKREIKVSSATIASVQSALSSKSPGFSIALQYIKAEEWATKWSEKISNVFGKK
jgi:TrpR-related protein YerC/YecD